MHKEVCSNKLCPYNKPENLDKSKHEIKMLKCPVCKRKTYHSEICLYNDFKHFSICTCSKWKKKNQVIKFSAGFDPKIFINSDEVKINFDNPLGTGGFATVIKMVRMGVSGVWDVSFRL